MGKEPVDSVQCLAALADDLMYFAGDTSLDV